MSWVHVLAVSWLVIAVLAALLIGRAVRSADVRESVDDPVLHELNYVAELPAADERPEERPDAHPDAPRSAGGPPTIPGIPSARPTLGRPSAPPEDGPTQQRSRPA